MLLVARVHYTNRLKAVPPTSELAGFHHYPAADVNPFFLYILRRILHFCSSRDVHASGFTSCLVIS